MLEPEQEIVLRQNPDWKKSSIIRCLVSLISVFLTQLCLSLIPLFLPTSSFLSLLPLAAVLLVVVTGLGRLCKKVAGVRASAPAFVFFSIFFIWAIYIYVIRRAISSLLDILMNIEIIMVLIGLCRIMSMDPGILTHHSRAHLFVRNSFHEVESQELKLSTSFEHQESSAEEAFTRHGRVRYCRHCKNYVMGFDHHCPAFGNCIGRRNHALFAALLVGFAISEASFVVCASQFTSKSQTSKEVGDTTITSRNLAVGTALFCLIQVLWQVVFIMWHVYCACYNIKTDEWINWQNYPEFRSKGIPCEGQPQPDIQFSNPYDKGILTNLKELLTAKDGWMVFHNKPDGPWQTLDPLLALPVESGQETSCKSKISLPSQHGDADRLLFC